MKHANRNTSSTQRGLTERIKIDFDNPEQLPLTLKLFDSGGNLIRMAHGITGSTFTIEKEWLPNGIYLLLFSGIRNLPRLIILN